MLGCPFAPQGPELLMGTQALGLCHLLLCYGLGQALGTAGPQALAHASEEEDACWVQAGSQVLSLPLSQPSQPSTGPLQVP